MNSTPDEIKDYKPNNSKTWGDRLGNSLPMPEIYGLEYLVSHLNNIGWLSSNGMGITSISFQEIQAYNELMKAHLSPDEVMTIKNMSNAYVRELNDKDPFKKAPYGVAKTPKVNGFVEAMKSVATVKILAD